MCNWGMPTLQETLILHEKEHHYWSQEIGKQFAIRKTCHEDQNHQAFESRGAMGRCGAILPLAPPEMQKETTVATKVLTKSALLFARHRSEKPVFHIDENIV